jgi:hypothetical protein
MGACLTARQHNTPVAHSVTQATDSHQWMLLSAHTPVAQLHADHSKQVQTYMTCAESKPP